MDASPIYFNEFDPFAAAWLGNLFPTATVDQRSITDVSADDLVRYERCHFFGGIGGWELALRLAGWPTDRRIDTGSCPCQPYSAAGKQKAQQDKRHLWPDWFKIIRKRRPECIVGEQVSNAIGHGWLDGIFSDMEGEDYTCGAIVLGAHSVKSPQTRQRLWWMAYTSDAKRRWRDQPRGQHGRALHIADRCGIDRLAQSNGLGYDGGQDSSISHRSPVAIQAETGSDALGLAYSNGGEPGNGRIQRGGQQRQQPEDGGSGGGVVLPGQSRLEGHAGDGDCWRQPGWIAAEQDGPIAATGLLGSWSRYSIVNCRDGKARRFERSAFPLADGVPQKLGRVRARLEGMGFGAKDIKRMLRRPRSVLALASRNRVGRLRGYGNAIVPELAAEFLTMVMEILES